MKLQVAIFIIILGLLHAALVTPMEKELVQLTFGPRAMWTLRPTTSNDTEIPRTRWDYGMPSGHANFAGLTGGLAFLLAITPAWVCATYIVGMAAQRVIWKRHTALQVIIGTALGIAYASLYAHLDMQTAVVACLLIIILWILLCLWKAKRMHSEDIRPSWASPGVAPLLPHYLRNLFRYQAYGHLTWKDVEVLVDMYVHLMPMVYDAVVPGDYGGTIVGPLVASKMGLPYQPKTSQRPLCVYTDPTSTMSPDDLVLAPQGALSWPWHR